MTVLCVSLAAGLTVVLTFVSYVQLLYLESLRLIRRETPALEFFRETLAHMKKLFRVEPRVVAHDLHPDYVSTRFACELTGVERIAVQHHHAQLLIRKANCITRK